MMVIFTSRSTKKSLYPVRRVMDSFADRIGNDTWKTIITMEGLQTVQMLLRRIATKNTAVACHWIRSRNHSELVWIVGRRNMFNEEGNIPVHSTEKDILHSGWENDWWYLPLIKALAALAGLFHDWGKASGWFQKKLVKEKIIADLYRHEWISCKLLEAVVLATDASDDDRKWLNALANGNLKTEDIGKYLRMDEDLDESKLPPLAKWLIWLILSHHKMPMQDKELTNMWVNVERSTFQSLFAKLNASWGYKNEVSEDKKKECFSFPKGLLLEDAPVWQKTVKKWCRRLAENYDKLSEIIKEGENYRPCFRAILYYARLSLMLADHYISSLPEEKDEYRWMKKDLWANTDGKTGEKKQYLEEHLVRVAEQAVSIAHRLPYFAGEMESVYGLRELAKKSPAPFRWQDKAVEKIRSFRERNGEDSKFFIVNMASTGCGKTFANAKIMQAVSEDGKSLRYILALGLRTLTLQTGDEYRERIGLGENDLAVLIGSRSVSELHDKKKEEEKSSEKEYSSETELLPEDLKYIDTENEEQTRFLDIFFNKKDRNGSRVNEQASRKNRAFLYKPVLVATIDHIMGATETVRGGRYILPLLRLMSSDLVIDEIDDFGKKDLIAIARLVHLAGLCGRNVGIGVSTQGFHSSAFGTGNHSLAGIVQRIPNLQAETSIEYTYQRDANGKFIDRTMWGGFSTLLGNSNAIVSKDLMNLTTPLDGFGNTLVGTNNKTRVANGSYMFGWNNTVYNSYFTDDEKLPTQFNGIFKVNSESFGGSVVAIGMDNTVNGAQHSYIMGTGNTVQGKLISKPNGVLEDVEEVATDNIVIGDKHKVDNASHTIIVGSADTETTIDQDGVVVIGHNANATAADGVALGSNSVASVAAGVAGYDPTTKTASTDTSATWKSTLGAVSVGVIGSDGTATATRQITGVAAGTNATDAVNVAQLTAVNTKVDANTTKITNLTTTVEGNKTHFFHVNQGTSGTNYNNDGAKGTNSIAIGKASTAGDNSVIIGQGSIANTGSGDIAIGMAVQVNSYANQGGGIAIGYNARSENMAGQQERYLSLGQSEYTTGIAIGRNSFARSGSTMVGTHNYSGAIGDVTLSSNPASSMLQPNLNPFATTVGANSFNSGTMSTVMGVYSIASSNYTGNNDSGKAPKNFGATIMGSLNSIESATADSNRAGVANSIVGLANRANNANGALIFGAGNEITNSVTPIVVPLDASIASAKDLQTNLISSIRASNSAGSTMAMGGGNKADYTQLTSIMGVNNTVTGTSDDISQYNYISGFNNTATNTDNVT